MRRFRFWTGPAVCLCRRSDKAQASVDNRVGERAIGTTDGREDFRYVCYDRNIDRRLWRRWPSRPRTHHCQTGIQSLARAAGRPCHPSLHRHGLWLFRLLAAAHQVDRHRPVRRLSGPDAGIGPLHHVLRLAGRRSGLDLYAVLRPARLVRGDLGRLAGAGRPASRRFRLGLLLVRRHPDRRDRRDDPSAVADVARRRRDRRHRARAWLYLAGLDADQVVPRPARHGDRHGDHGLRRRCDDRCAAGRHADEHVQERDLGRCLADLRRHGRHLLRLHDGRRLRLSHPAGRLASRRLRAAGRQGQHDHQPSRAPEERP